MISYSFAINDEFKKKQLVKRKEKDSTKNNNNNNNNNNNKYKLGLTTCGCGVLHAPNSVSTYLNQESYCKLSAIFFLNESDKDGDKNNEKLKDENDNSEKKTGDNMNGKSTSDYDLFIDGLKEAGIDNTDEVFDMAKKYFEHISKLFKNKRVKNYCLNQLQENFFVKHDEISKIRAVTDSASLAIINNTNDFGGKKQYETLGAAFKNIFFDKMDTKLGKIINGNQFNQLIVHRMFADNSWVSSQTVAGMHKDFKSYAATYVDSEGSTDSSKFIFPSKRQLIRQIDQNGKITDKGDKTNDKSTTKGKRQETGKGKRKGKGKEKRMATPKGRSKSKNKSKNKNKNQTAEKIETTTKTKSKSKTDSKDSRSNRKSRTNTIESCTKVKVSF